MYPYVFAHQVTRYPVDLFPLPAEVYFVKDAILGDQELCLRKRIRVAVIPCGYDSLSLTVVRSTRRVELKAIPPSGR